jgi:hypothetical protein
MNTTVTEPKEIIEVKSIVPTVEYFKTLIDEEKTLNNEAWCERLLQASNETGLSVETVLRFIEMYEEDYDKLLQTVGTIEDDPDYIGYLLAKVQEYDEMMAGAEDLEYGCDPYPEY